MLHRLRRALIPAHTPPFALPMNTPADQQAVDQILERSQSEPEPYRQSGLHPYQNLAAWTSEALALAPVGIAAAIESYVRGTIRELVDAGDPFVERVDKLKMRIKPGMGAMKALHGRRISLGQWVSHLVHISRIGHLDDHLCALFGAADLRTLLAEIRYFDGPSPSDFGVMLDEEPDAPAGETEEAPTHAVADPDRVIESLDKLFDARHRAAHEANPPVLGLELLSQWVEDAETFCTALSHLVEATLRPLEPFSTLMMELKAGTELDRKRAELDGRLDELYACLAALPPSDDRKDHYWSGLPVISPVEMADLARRAQEAYVAYEEAELDLQAYYWPDGTGWKTWRMGAELDLVDERSHRVAESLRNADDMFGEEDLPGEHQIEEHPQADVAAQSLDQEPTTSVAPAVAAPFDPDSGPSRDA